MCQHMYFLPSYALPHTNKHASTHSPLQEELAASGLWGHPGFVTPNINTTASGSSSLPASPTAARTGAQYHSPQRPPAPWLPWVEVAATARYEVCWVVGWLGRRLVGWLGGW